MSMANARTPCGAARARPRSTWALASTRRVCRGDQAVCTPDIVYRSVLATYRAGGEGIVYSPNYAGMNLSNLDGGARALEELGLKPPRAAVAAQ